MDLEFAGGVEAEEDEAKAEDEEVGVLVLNCDLEGATGGVGALWVKLGEAREFTFEKKSDASFSSAKEKPAT